MAAYTTRWFAKLADNGSLLAAYKTRWDGDIMKSERYWDSLQKRWLPTSDVTFSLLVWNNDVEEVDFAAIENQLPEEAKPKDPWANY